MKGLKEKTLSSVDILISPCDPDLRSPYPGSPETGLMGRDKKEADKSRLGVSKVIQEPGGEAANGNRSNKEKEELSELLLVGEDQMYPTLRSKSLNTNPRKIRTKMKRSEELPRTAASVRDLVSVFGAGQTQQDPGPGTQTGLR